MPENTASGAARVFLVAQPHVSGNKRPPNLNPLYDHGEVRVLIQSGDAPTFHPERCLRLIEERLGDFDPDRDYIAHAGGDTLALLLTGVVLADMAQDPEAPFTAINWLRYERKKLGDGTRTHEGAKYIPVRVPLFPATEER